MRNLVSYFIKYNISGDVLLVVVAIFGIFGLNSMRSTFFPESDTKLIAIRTTYPGASPEEIEEGIILKIEDNLTGTTGVDRISSVSRENTGTVLVEIKRGYNIDDILQEVKNAVDEINSFPADMEPPVISKQEVLTQALNFSVSGNVSLRTLKEAARKIESDLLAMPGISKVELSGFPDEEIEIAVREQDLRAYNMTFDQLVNAVRSANLDLTGGTIKAESEELLIRARSKGYYADAFRDIVVAQAPDGRRLRLEEIAEVRDQWADAPNRQYVNQRPAVGIQVSNTIDENLLEIADKVRTYIDDFNASNTEIQATIINDGSVLLRQRIDLLVENGVLGFVLVLILLAMFLQIRLAAWVALAIPISFLGMFMVASPMGISINVITLFGMILVIGILVDDGIVISENIYRHFEMGKDRFTAAIDGTMEVLPAVFSAIATTAVAFGSFLFLAGVTGDFFSELSIIVILTLAFSLVEGALILPAHISHSKALDRDKVPPSTAVGRFFQGIQQGLWDGMDYMKFKLYAPSLRFFLNNPLLGLSIPVALFILSISLVGGGFVKTTFFPFVESDYVNTTLKLPSGTREYLTQEKLDEIEAAVWRVNERYKSRRPDGRDVVLVVSKYLGPATNDGRVLIQLLDSETRQVRSLELVDSIRAEVGIIPEAENLKFGLANPFGDPVSVAIYGDNLAQVDSVATRLSKELDQLAELRDVADSNQEGIKEVSLQLREKAYLLGLTLQAVAGQVRQGFFGAEAQRLQRGQDEVKVWVRYDEQDRSSVGKLEDMRIRTPAGQAFPLREIADFRIERGVIAINRLDGKREIRVTAELADANVSNTAIIAIIENELLPPILAQYPDVSYSMEGQVRENGKTQQSAGIVFPIALILMLTIIILTFRSFNQTVAVLAIIPFGLIGVIFGHFIFGKTISFILSGLGVFALVGIMVNDALVLVSAHNTLIQEGKSFREALEEAAISRFRPIFLTSITTIAGLGPLIFEKSFQAQFLIPMALSVAFGLAVATVLVTLMLPILLVLFNRYKRFVVKLWEGAAPSPTEVEPALLGRKSQLGRYLLTTAGFVAAFSLILFVIQQIGA